MLSSVAITLILYVPVSSLETGAQFIASCAAFKVIQLGSAKPEVSVIVISSLSPGLGSFAEGKETESGVSTMPF